MKLLQILRIILPVFIIAGCQQNQCSSDAKYWIKESPLLLEEFLVVKHEILSDSMLLDSFTTRGSFFIGGAIFGPDKFDGFDVPKLKEWFKKGHGSISFSQGDTVATYRECESGRVSAWGFIQNTKTTNYNSGVRIIDSLRLRDNWRAEVVLCRGCGS